MLIYKSINITTIIYIEKNLVYFTNTINEHDLKYLKDRDIKIWETLLYKLVPIQIAFLPKYFAMIFCYMFHIHWSFYCLNLLFSGVIINFVTWVFSAF